MANRLDAVDGSRYRNNTYIETVKIVSVVGEEEHPFDLTGLILRLVYLSGDQFVEIDGAITSRVDADGIVHIEVPVTHETAMWSSTDYRLDTINTDGITLTKTSWKVLRR